MDVTEYAIESIQLDDRHFTAARIRKNVLAKFDYAVKLAGKKKQSCMEEAMEEFSDRIIVEHLSKKR